MQCGSRDVPAIERRPETPDGNRSVGGRGSLGLQEPKTVLQLGDTKGQIVQLVASSQPESVERALDGVVAAGSDALGLTAP